MNKKYLKNKWAVLLAAIIVFGLILFMTIQNQNVQIASLQKTIDVQNNFLKGLSKSSASPVPTLGSTQKLVDPHVGMKEAKGMNCQSIGHGQTDCTEYDYWYDPKATPGSATVPPNFNFGSATLQPLPIQ